MTEEQETFLELDVTEEFVSSLEEREFGNLRCRFVVEGTVFLPTPGSDDRYSKFFGILAVKNLLEGIESIRHSSNYLIRFEGQVVSIVYHLPTGDRDSMALTLTAGKREEFLELDQALTDEQMENQLSTVVGDKRAIAGAILDAGEDLYETILEVDPSMETHWIVEPYAESLEDARTHYQAMTE